MMRFIKWDWDLLLCFKVEIFVVEKNKTAGEKKRKRKEKFINKRDDFL